MHDKARSIMSVTPTPEQVRAAETPLKAGQIMLLNAYAGTGKTETLRLIAQNNPAKSVLYLSFNRQTAEKAKERFPRNTACRTIHSLAFRAVGGAYKSKLGSPTPRDVIREFSVRESYLAVLALETVTKFCFSTDRVLGAEHLEKRLQKRYPEVVPLAQKVWAAMQDLNSPIGMSHDGYLKLWSLGAPRISADIILLDEAQDTNPVTLKILLDQQDYDTSSLVFVGDHHQAIYGWRGAIDAMSQVRERADYVCPLTTSFRFGQEIANNASKILNHFKDDPVQLTGMGPTASELPEEAVIGRCNASLLARAIPIVMGQGTVHFAGTSEKDGWDPYYLYEMQIPLDLLNLSEGRGSEVKSAQIRAFENYKEVIDQIKGDGQGAGVDRELEKHVKLVDEYGALLPDLIDKLRRRSRSPEKADLSLSTAHRAKGLEWRSVEMLDDFVTLWDEEEQEWIESANDEEINLLYVAMTRPSQEIEYPKSLVDWLDQHEPQSASNLGA